MQAHMASAFVHSLIEYYRQYGKPIAVKTFVD
jgi:hypothetical protein